MRHRLLLALAVTLIALPAAAESYTLDRNHTEIGFSIRHLVTRVEGRFDEFDGTIQFDPAAPEKSSVAITVKAASIDTHNDSRDSDLRSANFFDVEKFPEASFKSTKVKALGGDRYEVTGQFTLHGVTKEITVPATFLGTASAGGRVKAGFESTFTIDRKDYGITWNRAVDNGGVLLGDEVTVNLSVEANKAEAAPAAAK